MDENVNGSMGTREDGLLDRLIDGETNWWTDGMKEGLSEELRRRDGRKDGCNEGRMYGRICRSCRLKSSVRQSVWTCSTNVSVPLRLWAVSPCQMVPVAGRTILPAGSSLHSWKETVETLVSLCSMD
jgi:hypothetical protein